MPLNALFLKTYLFLTKKKKPTEETPLEYRPG